MNPSSFLPIQRSEMKSRSWDSLDILLITGDAYVDHPSFGIPLLGRVLENAGFRVGILPQPHWRNETDARADFTRMGTPNLFIGISSGTVDSMLNNYTANKKPRSEDLYSEGGQSGQRPDYATTVYAQWARKFFPHTPLIIGGVEASLRRLAHYDYWQNRVRPSILLDLDADFLVYGMGEKPSLILAQSLQKIQIKLNAPLDRTHSLVQSVLDSLQNERGFAYLTSAEAARTLEPRLTLPSYEEVRDHKKKFAKTAALIEMEASPYNGKRLVQYHGKKAVVINPPLLPLSTSEFDALYQLPFTKLPHPSYHQPIPAYEMIRFSITVNRGCYGGCSFCAITLHQGRIVQSRSEKSILDEISHLNDHPEFKGIVSDVGGPTANMYGIGCKSPEIQSRCRKLSCLHPKICPHLQNHHARQIQLLIQSRKLPGIRKIFIASGLRYDMPLADSHYGMKYLKELISHHVGGQLKVAPEHLDSEVLDAMKKPPLCVFEEFFRCFESISQSAGKEQYLVPYFISGFPGSTHEKMKKIHDYLIKKNWKLQQVQAFIPTPMTLATAMYYAGIHPFTQKELFVAKDWQDKKLQQALLQPFRPENRRRVRQYQQKAKSIPKSASKK